MSRVYRFSDCRIDPARRELWRAGQLVSLPPQIFDFLAYLIERHDRAVGRDELVAAVWGKTEVSDTLLGQTVLRLRRELGDDAKQQRLLRTIPRFGYRWVAPLDSDDSGDAGAPTQQGAPAPSPLPDASTSGSAPRKRIVIASAALVFVLVLVAGAALFWRSERAAPSPSGGDTGSIRPAPGGAPVSAVVSAVLPAEIELGGEWSWLRLGVMDMVAGRLRSSGMPSVPSEDVVAWLKAPPATRGANLRDATPARLLVTPSVHREGDAQWLVRLDADDGAGRSFDVQARSSDVAQAARVAADNLLAALGTQPPAPAPDAAESALLRRVDAAVLADDPEMARALIAAASVEEQQAPPLRLRLAKIDFRGGRLDAARARLFALLDEAPAQAAPVLRASILNGLGAVAIREDRFDDATRAFGEAIDLLGAHPDAAQLGQAYLGRAAAAAEQHRAEAARADYARARIAFRQANDALALIRVAANEGFLDLDEDRPAQALPQLREAAAGFTQWGAVNEAIYASIGQINCHLALLDDAAALQVADTAAALAQRIENPSTLDALSIARARALGANGRLREARAVLERLRDRSRDDTTRTVAGVALARLELDASNYAAAIALSERASTTLADAGYANARAEAWLIQIRALQDRGDPAQAEAPLAAFEAWAAQSGHPRAAVFAQLARAGQMQRLGVAPGWREAFVRARQLAERNAVPLEIAAVARDHADALIGAGDFSRVAVEIGRVTRWAETDFNCAVLEARLYSALGPDSARQLALARARSLAGERVLPADTLSTGIPAQATPTH